MKISLGILVIWYISYGIKRCHEEGNVIKLEFNEFNPQICDLPFSIDSVVNAIIGLDSTYFGAYNIIDRKGYNFVLSADFNESSYIYVYRNNPWRRVREAFELSVTLHSLTKNLTRVTVRKYQNSIAYGVRIWKGPRFKYYYFKQHYDKTLAIQEYDFIRLLGKQLGYLKNMPFTKYPKELSQKQILSRFGNNPPFTVNEIFEYPEEDLEDWYKQNKRHFY